MKLGLSQSCYRWVFYRRLRRDLPAYAQSGERYPYFSSIPIAVEEKDAIPFLIERCREHELSYLYAETALLADPSNAGEMRRLAANAGVTFIGGANADWVATGADWIRQRAHYIAQMPIAVAAGATILCTTHANPAVHNHFSRNPPIDQQIDIMAANFREVARAAEQHGLVIAFENHQDYRCTEIARIIEAVCSPALRANFDTANSVAVIEDPVDAAASIGTYSIMAHLKDFRVQASTVLGEPRILWAPIGRGDLPLREALTVLRHKVADPNNLPLCLEVAPPPDNDPEVWVRDSLKHIRLELSDFLT